MSDNDLKKKPFIYSTSQICYYVFTYYGDFKYSCNCHYVLSVPSIDYSFCIYDFLDHNSPVDHIYADRKIILSSPNNARYKEFQKVIGTELFCMPEWSFTELSQLSGLNQS